MSETSKRRLLLIATRDPRGPLTGRKQVLKTIIESVSEIGLDVMVAHFGPTQASDAESDVRYVSLDGPNVLELGQGIAGWLVRAKPSLNEALYAGARAKRRIAGHIVEFRPDVIVSDMVRTARYAQSAGVPWIADLDDLLSERYRLAADFAESYDYLLGYHPGRLLRAALRLSKPARRMILAREASVLARREIEIARTATVVSLVNAGEAQILSRRAGVDVAHMPMAIRPPVMVPSSREGREGFVFVGPLDYGPNRRAISMFAARIAPSLRAAGVECSVLNVIGKCTDRDRECFSESVKFHGYVDDLDAALRPFEYMLLPEVTPGGVKTKIIHAMLNHLIVIAHDTAIGGTGLEPNRQVLVWKDDAELIDIIRRLNAGAFDKEEICRAAYRWASDYFAPDVIREKWRRNIRSCLGGASLSGTRLAQAPGVTSDSGVAELLPELAC